MTAEQEHEEDLHWLDAGTQAILDTLVESLPGAQLLLLISDRPEYEHDLDDEAPAVGSALTPDVPGPSGSTTPCSSHGPTLDWGIPCSAWERLGTPESS